DGCARPYLRERRPRPGPDHPHLCDRRRVDPPMGRRGDCLGLRACGGGRRIVGEGTTSPGGTVNVLAVAVAGRGLFAPHAPVFAADDEALLRGRAVFETTRVYGGRPF